MNYQTILSEIKQRLDSALPGLVDLVILYGSRSTGMETEDSDLDILIVLNDDFDWQTKNRIYDLCYEIDLMHGLVTDIRVISKNESAGIRGKQPYIMNALQEGISV